MISKKIYNLNIVSLLLFIPTIIVGASSNNDTQELGAKSLQMIICRSLAHNQRYHVHSPCTRVNSEILTQVITQDLQQQSSTHGVLPTEVQHWIAESVEQVQADIDYYRQAQKLYTNILEFLNKENMTNPAKLARILRQPHPNLARIDAAQARFIKGLNLSHHGYSSIKKLYLAELRQIIGFIHPGLTEILSQISAHPDSKISAHPVADFNRSLESFLDTISETRVTFSQLPVSPSSSHTSDYNTNILTKENIIALAYKHYHACITDKPINVYRTLFVLKKAIQDRQKTFGAKPSSFDHCFRWIENDLKKIVKYQHPERHYKVFADSDLFIDRDPFITSMWFNPMITLIYHWPRLTDALEEIKQHKTTGARLLKGLDTTCMSYPYIKAAHEAKHNEILQKLETIVAQQLCRSLSIPDVFFQMCLRCHKPIVTQHNDLDLD